MSLETRFAELVSYFICNLIGPTTTFPSTSCPFCRIRTLPASLSSKAVLRISCICLRQSSALSLRATSDGQIVLSLPRFVANDNIVSEMVPINHSKPDCDITNFPEVPAPSLPDGVVRLNDLASWRLASVEQSESPTKFSG